MNAEIRLPNITGVSEKEQLQQMKSYLYQLCEQLQWAFENVNTSGQAPGNTGYVENRIVRRLTEDSPSGDAKAETGGDAKVDFNELKSLIIKSAEIVDAFYQKISKRLEGVYVAQSDFGAYVEKTDLEIEATSDAITQSFDNLRVIITDNKNAANESHADLNESISSTRAGLVEAKSHWDGEFNEAKLEMEGLNTEIKEIKSYIKSGYLYDENGVPIYGVEIGQFASVDGAEKEKSFARFTSKKLAFFDSNGVEVAYISDRKLYIGQAEITRSYKIGGLEDTVMERTGDVVTRWVGGDW